MFQPQTRFKLNDKYMHVSEVGHEVGNKSKETVMKLVKPAKMKLVEKFMISVNREL